MSELETWVRYSNWANGAWIGFLESHLPEDSAARQRLGHIFLGEQAWFQRILAEPLDRDIWRLLSFDEIRDLHARHARIYQDLLSADLDRLVPFTRFTGEQGAAAVRHILSHLVTHGVHHRGQLATHTVKAGLMPVNTDFMEFCLEQQRGQAGAVSGRR
jgi:uncharacterized damage-inducible protein DinB